MDIIHLLPDSVANQIAAGEVVQRPSSVVKELVENALDAGATEIQINIKDAGRTLIQVIDNGRGMSETDARMAFERHATSKIQQADDLFHLQTMGFRGEALASISAVAQVELRTRRAEDELGILIEIAGSKIERQEAVGCATGSMFSVKNLFFNIPARRKFLKSNSTEFNHILNDFYRIAIVYPQVSFILRHDDNELFHLPESSMRQRIVNLFGKNINAQLLTVETQTSLVKITGFVGKPESARKQSSNQYFFVNGRYMNHLYFRKAVLQAYDRMIAPSTYPSYFLNFEIDPSSIDVNIHPTKTEIKFENEQALWSILLAAVREALGKFNVVPGIDFDQDNSVDMPVVQSSTQISAPTVSFNPVYNPFKPNSSGSSSSSSSTYTPKTMKQFDWEKLYAGFESEGNTPVQTQMEIISSLSEEKEEKKPAAETASEYFQFKGKYILTSVKSGLMFIDQHRAHERILYEQYLRSIEQQKMVSQQLLFPELIDLSVEDALTMEEIKDDLAFVGFDIDLFGKNTYRINGIPANIEVSQCAAIIEEMIADSRNLTKDKSAVHKQIALSLARATAMPYGKVLSKDEISQLVDQLFACQNHNYSPSGDPVIVILPEEEISGKF